MRKSILSVIGVLVLVLSFSACKEDAQPQEQAVLVNAMKVEQVDTPLNIQYPAQITGSLDIDIRAQVGGILKSRDYMEGAYIEKDTLMFVIDPQPYKVLLAKAQGSFAKAESDVKRTKREYERMKTLFKQNAVSAKEHDDSLSSYESAQANLVVAQAGVQDAEINLGYTNVTAPISGIASREAQSVGSLISPLNAQSSLLTTMVQTNPLYINFSIPSKQWNISPKVKKDGQIDAGVNDIGVEVILESGEVYPELGKIIFVDSSEDVKTASIAMKAEVPNPTRSPLLMPGKFVKVKITGIVYKDAIIIPSTAIASAAAGNVVYVVNAEGRVDARPVKVTTDGSQSFINEGLSAGETIIIEGLVKVRPGQKVKVQYATPVIEGVQDSMAPSVAPQAKGQEQAVDNMAPSVAPVQAQ